MKFILSAAVFVLVALAQSVEAEPIPQGLKGDWSLSIESGEAGWLSMGEKEGVPEVAMLVNVSQCRIDPPAEGS